MAFVIISPSSSRTSRNTPWVAGCDGPMLSTIFSPISSRFSRISASAAATRVTGSGDSISRVENVMASLGLCWREADAAQAQNLSREFARRPTPGGGWGFRRQTSRDRLANDPRLTNLLQLHPIQAIPGKDTLNPILGLERYYLDA